MESLSTRELIVRELTDKDFDEKKIELISGAIDEFEDLFGKYVNKEDVIRRLREVLRDVKFVPELYRDALGSFNEKGEISLLESLDYEKIKSVFFHEFIHCITYDPKKGRCGFKEKYEVDGMDDAVYVGSGLNEGFTQFVTKIRDAKYLPEQKMNAYPILSEQVGNLVELIGEEKFLDIGFNRPQDLPKEMGDIEEFEYDDFLDSFDVIWRHEKDIYAQTRKTLSNILLGFKAWEKENNSVKFAKQGIINIFQKLMLKKPINTIEEFNDLYNKISRYCEQLGAPITPEILRELQPRIAELQKNGLSIEAILNGVNKEYAIFYKLNDFISEFKRLSAKEKIDLLSKDDEMKSWKEDFYYNDDTLFESLRTEFANSIIQTNSEEESLGLYDLLVDLGLAQNIKEKGYNLDRLAVEYICFSSKDFSWEKRKIFNFYDTDSGQRTYLGTFGLDSNYTEICDFRPVDSKEDMEQIKQKHPQLKDAFILTSKRGEIIADMGDGQYILIDEYEEELSNETETSYSPSKLERVQDKILDRAERLRRLKELGAPKPIIEREEKMLEEVMQEMAEINGDKKITPNQIMEATEDISMQEVYQVLEEMTNAKAKREDIELGFRGKGEEIGD